MAESRDRDRRRGRRRIRGRFKRWLINGVAITIPLVITLLVFIIVIDFVLGVLSPIVQGIIYVLPNDPPTIVVEFVTLVSLVTFFLVVGIAADYTPGRAISKRVHAAMETIPGISTVYESVRRASRMLVDDDTEQFQDVKLVEFPHRDAYMLGFLTAKTPPEVEDRVDNGAMVTLMVPLGPNPTTNGFIMHMPAEHVYDVDITVEEAIRSIATLGVASNELGEDA
ncbi:DUF502 domain-containing protein [Natronorubrum sp. JWXQ-INN-674]|uniref:DUF502 domain-containing protein n=1 Tax=Natronorubrum halalkaliphilum TaxID=2691917 RepID=A0A6B0VNM2_9EURY|nr:DUF502 domain-containing protein [Natronorubrum halalkaliphilum]MXV62815.1 DUF502 domain-containing protein [Natronorubrum halalkaliphilum]